MNGSSAASVTTTSSIPTRLSDALTPGVGEAAGSSLLVHEGRVSKTSNARPTAEEVLNIFMTLGR